MLSTMKTMLFVSLALASNAVLPPWYQEEAEEDRIRGSPHLRELIGNDGRITKIEVAPRSERQRAGYNIIKQYTVSARVAMLTFPSRVYANRDFTVYVVHSKQANPPFMMPIMCGPIRFGLMFEDYYVEDPAAGQSGYVNNVKPLTKVPADCNGVKPAKDSPRGIGPDGIGPAYTRGEIEAPAGRRDMGSYTIGFYTPEQQARLGVDESGRPVRKSGKVPADCNGVKPRFPPMMPGPVIIDGDNNTFVKIALNPKSKVLCLPNNTIGYFTEGRMVGTFGHDQPAPTPFRSADESVVTCKLVRIAGLCGGEIYEHQFIAKNFGRTTVTNGSTTYTIQVGLLHDIKTDPGFDLQ